MIHFNDVFQDFTYYNGDFIYRADVNSEKINVIKNSILEIPQYAIIVDKPIETAEDFEKQLMKRGLMTNE